MSCSCCDFGSPCLKFSLVCSIYTSKLAGDNKISKSLKNCEVDLIHRIVDNRFISTRIMIHENIGLPFHQKICSVSLKIHQIPFGLSLGHSSDPHCKVCTTSNIYGSALFHVGGRQFRQTNKLRAGGRNVLRRQKRATEKSVGKIVRGMSGGICPGEECPAPDWYARCFQLTPSIARH